MAVVKVIEVMAESGESWEAAAKEAVKEASKTVNDIQNIYINGFKAVVKDNEIVKYRVDAKISFIVKD
jgi:flavin-binding protein dodecin